MKRLVKFFALLCVCLLVSWGWTAWHPRTAAAFAAVNDGSDKHDDGNKDRDKNDDDDRGCKSDDGDRDRDKDKDKDRDHNANRDDNGRGDDADHDRRHEGDDDHGDGNRATTGAFLTTIVNYTNGSVSSRSVIVLHKDRTMSVIDSGQGGPANMFSSQLGAWKRACDGTMTGRTLDFSFPSAGIVRVDYIFAAGEPKDTIMGTIVLTGFPLNANPLDGGGTVLGHFEFTGIRITAP